MECDCGYVYADSKGSELHYDNCAAFWHKLHPGKKSPKNKDGSLTLYNDHLLKLEVDILYHLGMDTASYDLPAMFGDVKFVCVGGTKYRMRKFAKYMADTYGLGDNSQEYPNLIKHSQRYAMFKVGPVLTVSHGIGIPSVTTLLQEVLKLMYYAKAKDPFFFRLGTSGGIGVSPGSVVVSSFGLSVEMEKSYSVPVLGKMRKLPSILDARLYQELHSMASESDEFETHLGGTVAADDFYRAQGRLDGPFCDYTLEDKMTFFNKLVSLGVKNIEMEANAFSAFTREAGVRAGIVCVTFIDRLLGDQVNMSKTTLIELQTRPMVIIGRFIAKYLERSNLKNGSP